MQKEKYSAADMTEGNPLKLIILFAMPMLIGTVVQQFYNVADAWVLGRFVGSQALAAVGATSGLVGVMMSVVMGFAAGGGIIISQALGSKKYREIGETIIGIIYIGAVMSVLICVAGIIFSKRMLILMSTPSEILESSASYIIILYIFIPITVCANASGSISRSLGDSRTPLAANLISTFVNLSLDVLFVAKFQWGIKGAAAATGIAQVMGAAYNIKILIAKRDLFNINYMPLFPQRRRLKRILLTGLPAALESSLLSLGSISVQRLVNSFGAMTIAAYTASTRIDSIAVSPIVAIGMAVSVYTAQNIGAQNIKRVKSGLYKTLAMLLCLCFVLAFGIVVFRRELLGLFVDSEEAINIGSQYLVIVCAAYFVAAVMRTYLNVLKGAGDVNISAASGITELVVRVVIAYVLVVPLKATGIWVATPIAWFCGAVIPVVRFYSGRWRDKRLV